MATCKANNSNDDETSSYRKAASYLLHRLRQETSLPSPTIGIICGSGLAGLSSAMTSTLTIPYKDIPGFPVQVRRATTHVQGHTHEVVIGYLQYNSEDHDGTAAASTKVPVMCFRGRFHYYEGYDMNTVAFPMRIMRCFNTIQLVIVTNAAGGLNPNYNVGDIVCITDHLALPIMSGQNPLRGTNDEELGPRFIPTSNTYDMTLQEIVIQSAKDVKIDNVVKTDGTYCFVSGPMYESKAESRFLRDVGCDAVGMSTVPEIVAAHHSGLKVLCLSVITNKVIITGDEGKPASHEEVLFAVQKASTQIQLLVKAVVSQAADRYLPTLPTLPLISLDITTADGAEKDKIRLFCNACKCMKGSAGFNLVLTCSLMFVLGFAVSMTISAKRK